VLVQEAAEADQRAVRGGEPRFEVADRGAAGVAFFYWHFTDRSALLAEMLDTWDRSTTQQVAERLDREGGDASARLRRLLTLTSSTALMTDLTVRDWGEPHELR